MRISRSGAFSVALLVTLATLASVGSAEAAGNTLRLEPATATVAKGATFTVTVVQDAEVATSGVQATIIFDRTKVQVTKVTRGSAWANAPLYLAGDDKAVTAANKNGKLKTVAAAHFPPGSVPKGKADFLVVELKALECGTVKLEMPVGAADASMLDGREASYGKSLKVTAVGGTVTVDCSGAAPTASADAPGAATGAPTDGSADPLQPTDPAGDPTEDPLAGPTTDPVATLAPGEVGAEPNGSPVPADPARAVVIATEAQEGWLTFALGALAVAAAGLALLIVLVVIAALVAAFVLPIVLLRYWRRASSGSPGPGDPAGPGAGGGATRDDGDIVAGTDDPGVGAVAAAGQGPGAGR